MGNFTVAVYLRLMKGLVHAFPKEGARKKHILEKMLYMSEINKKNCLVTRMIFNKTKKYALHLHEGDTLAMDPRKIWGIDCFDIILGNPPFNSPKDPITRKGYGAKSLWESFVKKSLTMLRPDSGYLLFIHPPSWRKPRHELWPILSTKQIITLKCYFKKEGLKLFECATAVDYYLLKNTKLTKKTTVHALDKKTYHSDLRKWKFLPGAYFDEIYSLLGPPNTDIIFSSSFYDKRRAYMSNEKTKEHIFPIMYNMTQKGYGFIYSSKNRGHIGVPKVILSTGRFQYPYNDWKGEYGMSNICFGLPIRTEKEGDKIIKAINTPLFKEILKYTKWNTFQTDWRMFQYFRPDFWKTILKD
jgi:hypothetical protein